MNIDRFHAYSNMMPEELKMLINDVPRDDLDWALVMYLFENTKTGNITLTKIGNFFDIEKNVIFKKLNKMSGLWIRQYLNMSEYGMTYYSYEITEIAADFMVKLVELLAETVKDKNRRK